MRNMFLNLIFFAKKNDTNLHLQAMFPENAQNRTRDVRGGMLPPSARKSDVEKGTIGGIGESLLKGMGWREGKGIGDRSKVRFHCISFKTKLFFT